MFYFRVESGVLGLSIGAEFGDFLRVGGVVRAPGSVGARDLDVVYLRSKSNTSVLYLYKKKFGLIGLYSINIIVKKSLVQEKPFMNFFLSS